MTGITATLAVMKLRLIGRAIATATMMIALAAFCAWALASCVVVAKAMAAPPPAPAPPPASAPAVYRWPLSGVPRVVVAFDPPAEPWLPGHRGVDLASVPGAEVVAAGAGSVVFAGTIAGVGVVSLAHDAGLRTTYEPVRPAVRVGQRVAAGERIGTLLAGHPSCPVGVPACLHWGLLRGRTYLDPLSLLGVGRVRLLPLRPGDTTDRPVSGSAAQRSAGQRIAARIWGRPAASRSYSSGWL